LSKNHTHSINNDATPKLKPTLGPVMLWGLGVGYVISGMYFGWNLGLPEGGTLGLAIATGFVMLMYITFTLGYTELACAIPKAGGAFDYATEGLGKRLGFLGGMAQLVEFLFAPPAIAFAIGAYVNIFFPSLPIIIIAIAAYIIFTLINIYGVKVAASFELLITIVAVIELLVFAGAALPSFEFENLSKNALPNGYAGVFAAIPFAMWFFLAIEGIANVAEETVNPQRNMIIGFGAAMATLVVLCILTFMASVGVNGWETVVYDTNGEVSDSPLPLVIAQAVGKDHFLYGLVSAVGLFGLVASFHGIILAAGRATFEFGRVSYIPKVFGKVHPKFATPANALVLNTFIGIAALLTGRTAEIITIACFGALSLYIIAMLSLFALRKNQPLKKRPFKVPFYPFVPAIALLIASVALVAMTYYNTKLAMVYVTILVVSYMYYYFWVEKKEKTWNNE
jgi:ethanolamine permease